MATIVRGEKVMRPAFDLGALPIAPISLLAAMIAIICIALSFGAHARRKNRRAFAPQSRADQDQSPHFLNALLGNGHALMVLGTTLDFGNANMLLQQCVTGPDAAIVAHAIDALEKTGQRFELSARTGDGRSVGLRGLPVGHRAVLYLQDRGAIDPDIDYRAILDALPAPIWLRSEKLSLHWGNPAFLAAVGASSLQDARASNAVLERSEVDLAAAARNNQAPVEARRFVVMGGQRRTLAINLLPLGNAGVAGIALDMSEIAKAHAETRAVADAYADLLERLPFCVARFDASQRLTGYTRNYAQLWDLPEAWLDIHPPYGEILGRLRETRKLPEQRDFAAWKQDQLRAFDKRGRRTEEFWHLPGGKSVRVVILPHLQGGLIALFEDITERLHLESAFNLLTQVQKATLDTLDEGIAIFGPDGRLVLHNAYFVALWRLTEHELADQPHITDIAAICNTRMGKDGIWSMISISVNSMEQERCGKWDNARRADGRIISLCCSRLPNGATVVKFMDLTDLEHFEALQRESAPDQAPAGIRANRNP